MQMGIDRQAPASPGSGQQLFSRIVKRDGERVPFDAGKITRAIMKAGKATGEFDQDVAQRLTIRVLTLATAVIGDAVPTVEGIQDLVEEVLLASPFKRTAKAYVLYRDQHARIREMVRQADLDLIDRYLQQLDWKVRENSNMAFSLQGLNNYISSAVSKVYWLNKIYTPEIRKAHTDGDLHIHDLGLLSVYCVGWDLQDVLRSGFRGAPGKAESGPARHFRSALGQIVNFFYTLQGEAAGAQAFSNFDTLLAPFIRWDGLDYREVKQALQEFVFNINVPTRVGFQTPFTNVSLDLQPPATLADLPVIIGGKPQDHTYGEFQQEMDLFNRALLEVLSEGDARGRVFTFPIPTYSITRDFNWDNPAIDRLWEVTGKYGIPYFANFVNSDLSPDDTRSMCCRLRLDLRTLDRRGGGLFGANPLTGSIGVVTINMPRIGFVAGNEREFLERLDHSLEIARTSLETKRKALERFTDHDLYPYTKYYLRMIKERYGRYWQNHFSTIGLIGMNEACVNLLDCDIGTRRGKAFAEMVLDHMRKRLAEFQEETGNLYNLEATPAEGTSYRLARLDRRRYPQMRSALPADCPDDTPYYTNSTQLPVHFSNDIFRVLDLQDSLQSKYTGGTALHIFLGEATPDPHSIRAFVRKVCQNYSLPYFTITPTFSICPAHGYLSGEQPACPRCGEKTEVYSRVVGYLRPLNQWNDGKQSEFRNRQLYGIAP